MFVITSVSGFNVTFITILYQKKVTNQIGGVVLANIKSAKKRILVNQIKADRNKAVKSSVKTAMKKVFAAIEAGDKAVATEVLKSTISAIESATSKGISHKNNAARKVSNITKAVNKMA